MPEFGKAVRVTVTGAVLVVVAGGGTKMPWMVRRSQWVKAQGNSGSDKGKYMALSHSADFSDVFSGQARAADRRRRG
jgi:hypothetical protein